MEFRDKFGWPVELFIGRPITNFILLLIHTDVRATWRYRNWNGNGIDPGPRSAALTNLRFRRVMTWSADERKVRLFRIVWERGVVGDGRGYSAFLSLGLIPRLAAFQRKPTFCELRVTLLGVALHYRRSYGGRFV